MRSSIMNNVTVSCRAPTAAHTPAVVAAEVVAAVAEMHSSTILPHRAPQSFLAAAAPPKVWSTRVCTVYIYSAFALSVCQCFPYSSLS